MRRLARWRNKFSDAVRSIGAAIAVAVPVLVRDLAGLGGAGLIAYGVWLIHPPSGFIAAGLMLVAGAALTALAKAP